MTPPTAVAERPTQAVAVLDDLRRHLSAREWDRLNLQMYEARSSRDAMASVLDGWFLTVTIRENELCKTQLAAFLETLHHGEDDAVAL